MSEINGVPFFLFFILFNFFEHLRKYWKGKLNYFAPRKITLSIHPVKLHG